MQGRREAVDCASSFGSFWSRTEYAHPHGPSAPIMVGCLLPGDAPALKAAGAPGPFRLQLGAHGHNQPRGAGRRFHERHLCFRRRENTTCKALCELPLDTVSGFKLGGCICQKISRQPHWVNQEREQHSVIRLFYYN